MVQEFQNALSCSWQTKILKHSSSQHCHLIPVSPTLCPMHLHRTKAPVVLERKTPSCTHLVTCSWLLQPGEKDKSPHQKTKQVGAGLSQGTLKAEVGLGNGT